MKGNNLFIFLVDVLVHVNQCTAAKND